MQIFYTDIIAIELPKNHNFPVEKYSLLRKRIMERLGDWAVVLRIPEPVSDEAILRAHDPIYLSRLKSGELTDQEIRRVGLPWSAEMIKRARYSAGATVEACRAAMQEGIGINLGGGTHHAFSDHGQGFCWLNDSVIASRAMQAEGRARRVVIIDCDVHQGNGTASMVRNDPSIFTFSIHGKNNFPYRKESSDLDIELPDGTDDVAYLEALAHGLAGCRQNFCADLAIYLAGADPYRDDQFGRLGLTKAGLAERDRLVFEHCQGTGIPVAVTMAGGYARQVQDIVDINLQTIRLALQWSALRHGKRN